MSFDSSPYQRACGPIFIPNTTAKLQHYSETSTIYTDNINCSFAYQHLGVRIGNEPVLPGQEASSSRAVMSSAIKPMNVFQAK